MHYNHFTIDYIKAVRDNLKIDLDSQGNASFVPEKINSDDILNLKKDLQTIWVNSNSAISVIEAKQEAKIQSGLFGLVNDLDLALKVGFLMGDRVVLIDYLYDRLLKKEPDQINLEHLGVITSSLVNALPLAEKGRIVIIPSPFNWNPDSLSIIDEVSMRTTLTPDLMSLLNMLSITKRCKLHPYTIAESEETYNSIINYQIDFVDSIGRDGSEYAYKGILGGLLSEKLLQESEIEYALNVSLDLYFEIISAKNEFYNNYLSEITSEGSLSAEYKINIIKNAIIESNKKVNKTIISNSARNIATTGSIGSGAIRILGAASLVSAPIQIIGAIMGLSSILVSLFNEGKSVEQPIISVFNKLYKAEQERIHLKIQNE